MQEHSPIQPVACLMLHRMEAPHAFLDAVSGHANKSMSLIATRHPVEITAHGPVIGPGNLLSEADKDEFMAILRDEAESRSEQFLDGRILVLSHRVMAWYAPPVKRKMHFSDRTGGNHQAVEVIWPGLVFKVRSGGEFSIAAFAGNRRPTPSTRLYHAPLQNIWAGTGVCIGTATIPKSDEIKPSSIPAWESVIYDTNFSHINHDRVLAGGADNRKLVKFWKDKAKSGKGVQAKEMTPLEITLDQWLKA